MKTIKLTVDFECELPKLPNFIMVADVKGEGRQIDVGNISDESLTEIGAAWSDALLDHANKRRKDKTDGR